MAWVTQVCEPYCDANALMGQTWRPSGLDLACMLKSLHSLCAGHGWAPVGPQLNLPHVKMLFPTAPTRPITCNMGMRMPGVFGGRICNLAWGRWDTFTKPNRLPA